MITKIKTVETFQVPASDRDGNEFLSRRTAVEFWTDATGVSQQGVAVAKVLRKLGLPSRRVQPLHVEQAYNAKGAPTGFRIVVTVA